MRSALITLALVLSAACASTTAQHPGIATADPATDDMGADTYEQYVDENGHIVTTHAKAQPAKQSTHDRLFHHWTSAYLLTR